MKDEIPKFAESDQFCDQIKLSEFNKIQSYGGLLVLDQCLHVMQCSENIASLLETPIEKLLMSPIAIFLKPENKDDNVIDWLTTANNTYKQLYWQFLEKEIRIWAHIHQAPNEIIIEIEVATESDTVNVNSIDLNQFSLECSKTIASYNTFVSLAQAVCQQIQKITGYDRVIIYQFNQIDHSGIVIGETLRAEMESYLGLHFPASDIPQHVRAMYSKIPLRYIPTIDDVPVKIIPETNPSTQKYLDLSTINLRMVAPVHVQYMQNMHITASASIAIIHDNKLWGLIACHHKEPKCLSVQFRIFLMQIANAAAMQFIALEYIKYFNEEKQTVELQAELTHKISNESSLVSALERYHDQLMKIISASGMSVYFQHDLNNYGETPNDDQVRKLIAWVQASPKQLARGSCTTANLPDLYKPSIKFKDKACGLLVMQITGLDNYYLLFYRPELVQSVVWAGNPADILKCTISAYSPRASFERFIETINNHSAPWSSREIKSAEFIRSIVVNKQLQDLLQVQAMHDPLTGLLNRLYLEQRLTLEIKRAERESKPIAIILIDLDFFKKINDNFGHQAGDALLAGFSKFLKETFRGYDYLYRYGGEEFLLVLPGINQISAEEKADALRFAIKKMKIKFMGQELPAINISVGISVYPANGNDPRSLIAAADKALYQAKSTGRDKVVIAASRLPL